MIRNSNFAGWRGWILPAGLIALGALVLPIDVWVSRSISLETVPGDVKRVLALSEFFAHGFGVLVILLAIWTLAPIHRRAIPRIATCAFLPGAIVLTMKNSIGRYRPGAVGADGQPVDGDWIGWFPGWSSESNWELGYFIQSFPSGHTATAFGLAIGLAWLLPRGKWLFFGLAVMAAAQRVVFLAHWPSDVLVGCAVAVLVSCWLTRHGSLPDRWFARYELPRRKDDREDDIQLAA